MGPIAFICIAIIIGLSAGVLGGLLGVGGGIVMVPAFSRLLGLSLHQAVGTSMSAILFVSIAATYRHAQLGNVDLKLLAIVATMSLLGGYLGASLAGMLSAKHLQLSFAIFLLIVAIDMLVRALRM